MSFLENSLADQKKDDQNSKTGRCDESIRLMREIDGVKTTVNFRDGKISAPIAFTGSYNPPLIGCLDFQGWADSTITLEFDQNSQTLIGRATVSEVRLSGTGGIGSSLIARLVQSSIDRKDKSDKYSSNGQSFVYRSGTKFRLFKNEGNWNDVMKSSTER